MAAVPEWGSRVGAAPRVELGTLLWPLRSCAGSSECSSEHSHLTKSWWMLFLTQCHTPQHARSLPKHDQVSLLLPLSGRDELWPPVPEVMVQCVSHSWSCCKTVHVLPGEKLPLLILHPKEPCRDPALQERPSSEQGGGQKDSAVGGTDPKGAHRTLAMDSCQASSPCPAGPAPAATNVGP